MQVDKLVESFSRCLPADDTVGEGVDNEGEPGCNGPLSLSVYFFLCQNKKHRLERAKRNLRNLHRRQWRCPECGGYVPLFRRADAVNCRERCRKAAARGRRARLVSGFAEN